MNTNIQKRLKELHSEYVYGNHKLHKLEKDISYLKETLLKISGAITVLEEIQISEKQVKIDSKVNNGKSSAEAQRGLLSS